MNRTGFTLLELTIILAILGVTMVLFYPSFTTSAQVAYSQAAKNNLMAIYSAQVNYFNNNNGAYCWDTSGPCDTLADINTNLNLNISDSVYSYVCCSTTAANGTKGFLCWATNGTATCAAQTGNTQWQVTNGAIVLTGAGLNPSCNGGTYCPS